MTEFGTIRSWTCPPPTVDPVRILRVHKYADPDKVRPVIRRAAETAAIAAAQMALPDARYVSVPIDNLAEGSLNLANGITFHCPAFQEHLAGCDQFLAFIITIGPTLDEKVISLVHDTFEPLDALFLETAGWLTIEAATKHLARHLKQDLAVSGQRLSLRMGPGYEYRRPNGSGRVSWDLLEQRQLFAMFDGAELPVELLSSCAMKPKMSRSGAFGIYAAPG